MASLKEIYNTEQRLLWQIQNQHVIDVKRFKELAVQIYRWTDRKSIAYSNLSNAGFLYQHGVNVGIISSYIIKSLFDDAEVISIKKMILGDLLHDVGKLFTVPTILDKPGNLDSLEKEIMDTHTILGQKVVSKFIDDEIVNYIVLNHHSIYKNDAGIDVNTLSVDQPQLYTYISSIADIVDAMLSLRCYKDAHEPQKVIVELKNRKVDDGIINFIKSFIQSSAQYLATR